MRAKGMESGPHRVQGKRTLTGSLEDSGHFGTDSDEPSHYAHSRESSRSSELNRLSPHSGSPKGVGHSVWSSSPSAAPFGDTLSSDDADTIPSVPSPRPAVEKYDKQAETRESRNREPKWTYQMNKENAPKSQEVVAIVMEQKHVDKGFGFTVRGGKDRKEDVVVGGVVVGSVADKARLQVGDVIVSLNGESVGDKLLPKINHIIREALRLGEIELQVKRTHFGGAPKLLAESPRRERSPRTKASFDEKRSLFSQDLPPPPSTPSTPRDRKDSIGSTVASYSSFSDTHRQASQPSRKLSHEPTIPRPEKTPEVVNSAAALQNRGPVSPILQRAKRPGRIEDWVPDAERSPSPNDYRVTSLAQKPKPPGKITDFVPESERSQSRNPANNRATSNRPDEEMDSHWKRENDWIAARIGADGERRSRSRDEDTRKSFNQAFQGTFAPPPPQQPNRLTVTTAQSDTTSSKSTASPASSQLTSPHSSSASEGKELQDFPEQDEELEEVDRKPIYNTQPLPEHTSPPKSVSRVTPEVPKTGTEERKTESTSFERPSPEISTSVPKPYSAPTQLQPQDQQQYYISAPKSSEEIPRYPGSPIEKSKEEEEKKPFSHVKKDVVFSAEPPPWEKKLITARYPPLSKQLGGSNDEQVFITTTYRAPSPPLVPITNNTVPKEEELIPTPLIRKPEHHTSAPMTTKHEPQSEQAVAPERYYEPPKASTVYSPIPPSYTAPVPQQPAHHTRNHNESSQHNVLPYDYGNDLREPGYGSQQGRYPQNEPVQIDVRQTHDQYARNGNFSPGYGSHNESTQPFREVPKPKLTAAEQLALNRPYSSSQRINPQMGSPNQNTPGINVGPPKRQAYENQPQHIPSKTHQQSGVLDRKDLAQKPMSPIRSQQEELRETELRFLHFAAEHQYEDEFRRHHKDRPKKWEELASRTGDSSRLAPSPAVGRSPIPSPNSPYIQQYSQNRPQGQRQSSAVSPKSYAAPRYSYESTSPNPSNYTSSSSKSPMLSPTGNHPQYQDQYRQTRPDSGKKHTVEEGEPESPPLPSLPPPSLDSNGDVVSVSGRQRCTHCDKELGRGAAMIIESLNLFYHLSCFRCYVCRQSLGTGGYGADVRVRDGKLHCQSCYSNDEAGLKFSEV